MSLNFWKENNFRLEPWGTDYQSPIDLEELSESSSEVDPTVEAADWSKFKTTKPPELPQQLIFIDGRRRIDAALVGGSGNTVNCCNQSRKYTRKFKAKRVGV